VEKQFPLEFRVSLILGSKNIGYGMMACVEDTLASLFFPTLSHYFRPYTAHQTLPNYT